ncbi:MAG: MBL fold metallo-hydrolase [Eubacteriales bacterium]|nr:MBL fold metallo-hydrolase [Eubacteriales bacterium]
MKLMFLGAAHEVTGSCIFLEACGKKILIDYGMEQGTDVFENEELPVAPGEIDMVFLTHAHIDHSGKLPLLYQKGFQGQIFATEATEQLCRIMLRDSAHIQEFEAEWRNRKGRRAGKPEYTPLYTVEDAERVLKCFVGCSYNTRMMVADGIEICFVDAGHLLGSSSIEVTLNEEGTQKTLVFSGDIGNDHQPLIRDPQYLHEADYVIMESTYGDRSHGPRTDYVKDLAEVIQTTFDKGGNVVIPAFAVGRSQEMLYFLRKIKEDGLVKNHDGFEVWLDSPLAAEATGIFMQQMRETFDDEAMDLVNRGINPIGFAGLKIAITSDESRQINFDMKPKVIISASGMCEAGRIKHHLKHNLWRPECTILFVGYQANGTLGRALVEGAEKVHLFGEEIDVQAKICVLPGISGHADNTGLMRWISAFDRKRPERVFVVHGEDQTCMTFAQRLEDELSLSATAPYSGTIYDLKTNTCVRETFGVRVEKKAAASSRSSMVFERLLAAGARLLAVIRRNEGGANKDLAKFTDQINALADKWER